MAKQRNAVARRIRATAVMLITGLFGVGATTVNAGPAQAANLLCHTSAPDIDHGSYHSAVVSSGAWMYDGPHDTCGKVAFQWPSDRLDYYCYTRNAAGNTWTLLRNTASNRVGWVWDGYLTDGGSFYVCQGGDP